MEPKPMTRKEEIERASNQYAWANEYLRMDKSQCRRALATTPIEDLKMVNIGDIVAETFFCGAAWADVHPDRKALLSDEANEREVAFCDAWFAENNQFPTFGHAIEWADRTMVEQASACIETILLYLLKDEEKAKRGVEYFKETMGYDE